MDRHARIGTVQERMRELGIDALLVGVGPDLAYLTGYSRSQLERLICLVVPADDADGVRLVVPEVDRPSAAESLGWKLELLPWTDAQDPYALAAAALPGGSARLGIDDHMATAKFLALRERLPTAQWTLSSEVLAPIRARKSPEELDELRRAAEAVDRVHERIPGLIRPGRTEREIAADIARAQVEEGHERADYVIVAAGPHAAAPHHQPTNRVLERDDVVVVDLGAVLASGYWSDCTRTYVVGDRPPSDFARMYAVLQEAQAAQRAAVRPGVLASELDAIGRRHLADAGLGDLFIHRTGHGIGLEIHEPPYIAGNDVTVLESGMTFTIEPGFYLDGRFGARIEDVVAVTDDGAESLNTTSRDLGFCA